jgi:hypothetical protein
MGIEVEESGRKRGGRQKPPKGSEVVRYWQVEQLARPTLPTTETGLEMIFDIGE